MRVKIYQINGDRDKNRVKFSGLDEAKRLSRFDGIDASIYDKVFNDMLDDILREAGMPTDTTMPFYVEDIHYPAELSRLGGKDVNLDELNYLAKKLDCMTDDEINQFYAAMEQKDVNGLKNLAVLNDFLIIDFSEPIKSFR